METLLSFFLIYADDRLVIIPDSTRIQDIVRLLAKAFSMKDLGQAHFFSEFNYIILQLIDFSLNVIISSQFFSAQKWKILNMFPIHVLPPSHTYLLKIFQMPLYIVVM